MTTTINTASTVNAVAAPAGETPKTHLDLHVQGIGYLNRIREVKVKRGSFWACSIAALHGDINDPETTYFDCKIEGAEALDRVKFLMSAVEKKDKVVVSFKLGDIYPESFVYQSGEKSGQTGVSIKGRLLQIRSAKINGISVDFDDEVRIAA